MYSLNRPLNAIREYLAKQQSAIYEVLSSQVITPYAYQRKEIKGRGVYDANSSSRRHFVVLLLFSGLPEQTPGLQEVVRQLFREELIDRQTDSFQGIGLNLEMLTYMLSRYQKEEDQALFEAAKVANFDCICGYSWQAITVPPIETDLTTYTWQDILLLAELLALPDISNQVVDILQREKEEWTLEDLNFLRGHYLHMNDSKNECLVLKEIAALVKQEKGGWDGCCADIRYLEKLVLNKEYKEAKTVIVQLQNELPLAKEDWYTWNPGKNFLEYVQEVIVLHQKQNEELEDENRALWEWSYPYLRQVGQMYGNLATKTAASAKKFGETQYAEEVAARWARDLKEMGL